MMVDSMVAMRPERAPQVDLELHGEDVRVGWAKV
jgi:hypothetical protein